MSLLEAVLSAALFCVVFFVAFNLFDLGSYNFHVGLLRHGLQSETRTSWTYLERDLRQTVLSGMSLDNGPGRNVTVPIQKTSVTVPRQIVSLPSLSNWAPNTSTFDPDSGLPKWDRYVVYQATLDVPDGAFYRFELAPAGGDASAPFASFATLSNVTLSSGPAGIGPVTGGSITGRRKLASDVLDFSVSITTTVNAYLKLRGKAHSEASQSEREETFEVNVTIAPNNSIQ